MRKGLIKIDWENFKNYSDEEITYFLFLEGKPVNAICNIRNLSKETVQKHIIDGKIKYGILVKSKNEKELFSFISKAGKLDKIEVLNSLDEKSKNNLVNYIRKNYVDMFAKEKETAVWVLGELREEECGDVLRKACVHNLVNVRRMAVSAMSKIGSKEFEIPLIRALEDKNPQVVAYAIKALTKMKSIKANEKVKSLLEKTEKEYIKKAAEAYFDEMKIYNEQTEVN